MLSGPTPPFFLIRHGETEWNREGRLQGQRDIPLNPVGRDQAAAAGRKLLHLLRRRELDPSTLRAIASPLGRARDTMERARQAMGLAPKTYATDDRLRELSFGDWEGLTWPEVKVIAPDSVRERKRDKWGFVPPDGESYAQLAERVRPWLATVRPFDLVVAHGGVARVLMYLLGCATPAEAPNRDIWQGRVLVFENDAFRWD